jgi:hypothetical protein
MVDAEGHGPVSGDMASLLLGLDGVAMVACEHDEEANLVLALVTASDQARCTPRSGRGTTS